MKEEAGEGVGGNSLLSPSQKELLPKNPALLGLKMLGLLSNILALMKKIRLSLVTFAFSLVLDLDLWARNRSMVTCIVCRLSNASSLTQRRI